IADGLVVREKLRVVEAETLQPGLGPALAPGEEKRCEVRERGAPGRRHERDLSLPHRIGKRREPRRGGASEQRLFCDQQHLRTTAYRYPRPRRITEERWDVRRALRHGRKLAPARGRDGRVGLRVPEN